MSRLKSLLKKTGRGFLWFLTGLLGLIVLIFIFINIPVGKRVVKNKLISILEKKINTKISAGQLDYSLPNWVKLKNVFIQDQRNDTLLFGGELAIDISMLKLMSGETEINKIGLTDMVVKLNRSSTDSIFNYQFLVDAFTTSAKPKTIKQDTAALKLSLKELQLKNVSFQMKDAWAGNDMKAYISQASVTTHLFQPDRLKFYIDDFNAKGVRFTMDTYKPSQVQDTVIVIDTAQAQEYGLFITAGHFKIEDVIVRVDDQLNKLHYDNNIKTLSLSNALFNISQSVATADSILLDSSKVSFSTPLHSAPGTDTIVSNTPPWLIKVANLNIINSDVDYNDINVPKKGGLDFSHLSVNKLTSDIRSFLFSTDTTRGLIQQLHFSDQSGFVLDSTHANFSMSQNALTASEVYIRTPASLLQNDLQMSYDSLKGIMLYPQNTTITTTFTKSRIAFKDIYLLVPSLKVSLPQAKFGSQFLDINAKLQGNLKTLNLPYFQLVGLSGSSVNARGVLYNLTDSKRFAYDLQILNSRIYKRDILQFIPPALLAQLGNLPDVLNLSGKFKGNANDLMADVRARGTNFDFNGLVKLYNFRDPAALKYDMQVGNIAVTKQLIMGFLPPTVQQQINLPERIVAQGKFKGNSTAIDMDLKLLTSYGNAKVKGFIKNFKDPNNAVYDLQVQTPGFNIGKLLRQDSILGMVAGSFAAKGKGFDVSKMQSDFRGDIASIDYNKYNYKNIKFTGSANRGNIEAKGTANDPNLSLAFNAAGNFAGEYPTLNAVLRIDTAQLQPLHLYDSMFNISGLVKLNARNLRPRNLDATLLADTLRMQYAGVKYFLETVSVKAFSNSGIDSIILRAPFAKIDAGGAFDYDKIGISLQRYVNNYYKLPATKQYAGVNVAPQQFAINGNVQQHPLVLALVPGLQSFRDINFSGAYNSSATDSALQFSIKAPAIQYQNYTVKEGSFAINSTVENINYNLHFDTLNTGTRLLYGSYVRGAAAHDSISLNARTQDENKRDWFGIAGTASVNDTAYSFRVQDSLIINYENWNVQQDNFLSYNKQGIIVHNFKIQNDTTVIAINSQTMQRNSPIDINIKDFDLESITSFVSGDTLLASGVVNMTATVSDLDKKLPGFTGRASVTNLEVYQKPVGNLIANAQKISDNTITADVLLTGNGNDVEAKGNYYLNNTTNQFDADLDMRSLSFKTIEAFSAGALTRSSGTVSGDLKANGMFAQPRWKGQLEFDTAKFTLTQLGTPYFIDQQKLIFDYPRVTLNKFTIKDSLDHSMVINGYVETDDAYNLDLNLGINAKNFTVVNAKQAIGSQFYGYAAVDANVQINGTATAPDIEGNILVNNQSDLTILLPEADYAKDAGDNLVRFIDRDTFEIDPPVIAFRPAIEPANAFAQFLNYNLNIQVNKEATFTIVLDPITGDKIEVQGDARLNAGVDPGGNLVLAGVYNLDRGYYDFSYQFINRKFNLSRGSTINFAGNPLDAIVNITATYAATTTAGSLLSNEVSNADPALANALKQKLRFDVQLNLTGPLNKPKISFDIVLPAENQNVNSSLQSTVDAKLAQIRDDEAAMNKQVFSLLIFNRFAGEQSSDFFKGNGGSFSELARQSVSQFLNEAINQIAGDLIKGVNIDLNLNSYQDYSTGNATDRTDLDIAVSKSFLNDRLTVSVGENFGLQGADGASKAAGTQSGFKPNISLGYKLTADGKYLLRAYTKNQYEATIDGFVVETGLSFVVTLDFDKFNELFKFKRKK